MAKYNFGMIGLGTMGRNLVLNMYDHGHTIAGYDKSPGQVETFRKEAGDKNIFATHELKDFLDVLETPKTILLLVPAGAIVDAVLEELIPLLSEGDLVMDCGNSHFTDTNRRIELLSKKGLLFMGVGISGGEFGARYGPSIMPGGSQEAYERVSDMLKNISAKVNDEPCVDYMGKTSAGHYVKMVHNGIEYGIMQLIAECYHLLKEAGKLRAAEIHKVFAEWNKGRLQSFLVEITADIFIRQDEFGNDLLLDMIMDTAGQKGTGQWTSEDALELHTPVPTIDSAVTARVISSLREERQKVFPLFKTPENREDKPFDSSEFIAGLEQALYFSMMITYTQGMHLLQSASRQYDYGLDIKNIASIWRGGCIIRSSMLEDIRHAYTKNAELPGLLFDESINAALTKATPGLRQTIISAIERGIPVPAMMSAIAYFDSYRRDWLPSNLIQAQRDYFGAHTYQRLDREGIFHTSWEEKQS